MTIDNAVCSLTWASEERLEENPNLGQKIIFSDEAHF